MKRNVPIAAAVLLALTLGVAASSLAAAQTGRLALVPGGGVDWSGHGPQDEWLQLFNGLDLA